MSEAQGPSALTGDSHVEGPAGPGHPTPGWWPDLIGPGRAVDTDEHFVICANVLGGCRGSTGPSSLVPGTVEPYGLGFPEVTVWDMVRAQLLLVDHLGVRRVKLVTGGSMGGQQTLAWKVAYPEITGGAVPISTGLAATPMQIAFDAIGRNAIFNDPEFAGGRQRRRRHTTGHRSGPGPHARPCDLPVRRELPSRFGRATVAGDPRGVLRGRALRVRRRRPGSRRPSGARPGGPVGLAVPPQQQRELIEALRACGVDATYTEIDSPDGHDGLLLATGAVGEAVRRVLAR